MAEARKLAEKVKKGKNFDLDDFKSQIVQMRKMGGLSALMDKMPGMGQMPQMTGNEDKAINRVEGIINSMTPQERRQPELIKASRKRRIAAGAGVQVQEINRMLNQFEQAQKMMKMMGKGGLGKMMRGMKGMLPGGR
jgi:signal recognition particle subunit SRP54